MVAVVHPPGLDLDLMRSMECDHPYTRTQLTISYKQKGDLWEFIDESPDEWGFVRIRMISHSHAGEIRHVRACNADGRSEFVHTWIREVAD